MIWLCHVIISYVHILKYSELLCPSLCIVELPQASGSEMKRKGVNNLRLKDCHLSDDIFKCIFFQWKYLNFLQNVSEIVRSWCSNTDWGNAAPSHFLNHCFSSQDPWCHMALSHNELTHWGGDKMATISQTTLSNAFSSLKMLRVLIKIWLKFVPKGPINNIPALVKIMAWRRPGDKPLSEPMMIRLLTAMRHSASMG